jgi:hypothetical protein
VSRCPSTERRQSSPALRSGGHGARWESRSLTLSLNPHSYVRRFGVAQGKRKRHPGFDDGERESQELA